MKLGGAELLVIFLVMFFVLGPEKTALYARKIGKWLRVLKVYVASMTDDLKETVVEPLQEMQEPLREITRPFEELTKDVGESVGEISKSMEDISFDVKRSMAEVERAATMKLEKPVQETPVSEQETVAETLEMAEFVEET